MEINTFNKILKKRWRAVLSTVLIFLAVALIITLSQPLKYRSTSKLLVVQEGTFSDPYTVAKSNQYISSLLSEAVSSGSFFQLLSSANDSHINWAYFNGNYKQQLKEWKKTVTAQNVSDTGVMQVSVYHPDASQAEQIALVVNNAIVNQNSTYQGMSGVKIKVIDEPTTSSFPVKPNLPLSVGAAIIFGLIFGGMYIYYFPVSRQEKRRLVLNTVRQENNNHYETKIPVNLKTYSGPETTEQVSFHGNIRNIIN